MHRKSRDKRLAVIGIDGARHQFETAIAAILIGDSHERRQAKRIVRISFLHTAASVVPVGVLRAGVAGVLHRNERRRLIELGLIGRGPINAGVLERIAHIIAVAHPERADAQHMPHFIASNSSM